MCDAVLLAVAWAHVACCAQEVFGRIVHTKLSSDRCIQACIVNIADWGGDVRDRVVRSLSAIHRSYDNAKVCCVDVHRMLPVCILPIPYAKMLTCVCMRSKV